LPRFAAGIDSAGWRPVDLGPSAATPQSSRDCAILAMFWRRAQHRLTRRTSVIGALMGRPGQPGRLSRSSGGSCDNSVAQSIATTRMGEADHVRGSPPPRRAGRGWLGLASCPFQAPHTPWPSARRTIAPTGEFRDHQPRVRSLRRVAAVQQLPLPIKPPRCHGSPIFR